MRTRRTIRSARAGLTALELILASALLGIILFKGYGLLRTTTRSTAVDTNTILLEQQAHTVLERIARAVMGSNRQSLNPAAEQPLSSDDMRYQVQLGLEDGEVVWSEPEMIGLDEQENRLFWTRNPDEEEEMRVTWTNVVRPFLEGEILDGMDNNGNGLIDERGLSFVVDRNAITIRLTLERQTPEGGSARHSVQTTVMCRNLEAEAVP